MSCLAPAASTFSETAMVNFTSEQSTSVKRPRGDAKIEKRKSKTGAGFTLLEVLLVLALIGLLAGLLIGGSMALISKKTLSIDEVFWQVVQESRKTALESAREVHLSFDQKEKAFVIDDGTGPRLFPVSADPNSDFGVDFLSLQKSGSTILLGGVVIETQPLPTGVTFYDDGTCTPFRVQIRASAGAHILSVDPWTGAAILAANDALNR